MNPNVILCPIELSASGRYALVQAVELARWYDADLHVAHVRGGRAHRQVSGEPLNASGVDPRLSSFIEAVDTEGLRLSTVALAGDPLTAVTEYAKLIGADLVVVARHGRRYGVYWRPGVYAKDLARALSCPTLAVPDGGGNRRQCLVRQHPLPNGLLGRGERGAPGGTRTCAAERRQTDTAARSGRISLRDGLLGWRGLSVDRRVPRPGRQDLAADAQCGAPGRLQLVSHRNEGRLRNRPPDDRFYCVRTRGRPHRDGAA